MTPAPDLDDAPTAARPTAGRALAIGTRLRDYEITGLVGDGGFGIVYLAWDHSLQRKVAVKEYMPAAMAARDGGPAGIVVPAESHLDLYRAGLKGFVNEARLLARFDHPSLVKVYRFWEENGTAYRVMPFYEGPTLKNALAELGHVPGESELRTWLRPILDALTVLHEGRTWHQNVGPDEIVLTPVGPVLFGFGAAAHAVEAIRGAPEAALKPGFAAIEQYGLEAGLAIGPWTDLYGLAAVVYAAIAGVEPLQAPARAVADSVQPLTQVAAGLYTPGFLAAIDAALAVQPAGRPRDHEAFRALMGDIEATPPVSLAPPSDLMQELFLGDVGAHREITVPDRPPVPAEPPAPIAAPAAPAARPRPPPNSGRHADSVPAGTAPRARPVTQQSAGSLGRRALYGIVAATCACIGLAALGLQYYLRPPVRSAVAQTPPGFASTAMAAASATTPIVMPATTGAAPQVAVPALATTAAIAAPASAATAAPASAALVASPSPAYSTGPDPLGGRQARCVDILQKASLETISPADTEFFKKECK